MELVYTDANLNDIGFLKSFDLDMEDGDSKHDFQLQVPKKYASELASGAYIYVEDNGEQTSFGGKIAGVKVSAFSDVVTFSGITWLGLLDTRVFYTGRFPQPPPEWPSDQLPSIYLRPNFFLAFLLTSTNSRDLFDSDARSVLGEQRWYSTDPPLTLLEEIDKNFTNQFMDEYNCLCRYEPSTKKIFLSLRRPFDITVNSKDQNVNDFEFTRNDSFVTHLIAAPPLDPSVPWDIDYPYPFTTHHTLLRRSDADVRPFEIDWFMQYQYDAISDFSPYYTGKEEVTACLREDINVGAMVKKHEELLALNTSSLTVGNVGVDLGDYVTCVDDETGFSVRKRITSRVLKMTESSFNPSYS